MCRLATALPGQLHPKSDVLLKQCPIVSGLMLFKKGIACRVLKKFFFKRGKKMDHIDRRSDFPTEFNEEAIKVVESAPISDTDKEKMFQLNAEKLFQI
jgi:hypothetical protein